MAVMVPLEGSEDDVGGAGQCQWCQELHEHIQREPGPAIVTKDAKASDCIARSD